MDPTNNSLTHDMVEMSTTSQKCLNGVLYTAVFTDQLRWKVISKLRMSKWFK